MTDPSTCTCPPLEDIVGAALQTGHSTDIDHGHCPAHRPAGDDPGPVVALNSDALTTSLRAALDIPTTGDTHA